MDNANAAAKNNNAPSAKPAAQAGKKPAKKIEVDDFMITGAKVHFKEMTLPLPPIHLTDLGKGPEGITAVDLTRRVLDAVVSATVKAVVSTAADIGKGAENVGKDVGKAVGGGVNKVTKSIGGLFGK